MSYIDDILLLPPFPLTLTPLLFARRMAPRPPPPPDIKKKKKKNAEERRNHGETFRERKCRFQSVFSAVVSLPRLARAVIPRLANSVHTQCEGGRGGGVRRGERGGGRRRGREGARLWH